VRAVNPSLVLVHQLVLALKRVVTTVDRLVISLVVVRILALKVKRGKKLTVLALSSVVASTVEKPDIFLLTAPKLQETSRATTVAEKDTFRETVLIPGNRRISH